MRSGNDQVSDQVNNVTRYHDIGAGKSSLIRLLLGIRNHDDMPMVAPVIGRSNVDVPTSADVHLFLDPASEYQRPILFADCEGFEGGERDTIAQAASSNTRLPVPSSSEALPSLNRILHFTKRVLRWASRDSQDHEKTSKRQYAVAEMYPRIFHAFSDVIVFVLNNPRSASPVSTTEHAPGSRELLANFVQQDHGGCC